MVSQSKFGELLAEGTKMWMELNALEWMIVLFSIALFVLHYHLESFIEFLTNERSDPVQSQSITYPVTSFIGTNSDHSFEMFDKKWRDPFNWLEDSSSFFTQEWMKAEKKCFSNYLPTLRALRQKFNEKLEYYQHFELVHVPFQLHSHYFFCKKAHAEDAQFSLYSTTDFQSSEAKLILNPNKLYPRTSTNRSNTYAIVHGTWISEDVSKLAIGYSHANNISFMTITIKDLVQSTVLSVDTIHHCSTAFTSVCWLEGRTGFFYSTGVSPSALKDRDVEKSDIAYKRSHIVMFHRLGTQQSEDLLVYEVPVEELEQWDQQISINLQVSSDGHYLLLEISPSDPCLSSNTSFRTIRRENYNPTIGNKFYYFDLSKFDGRNVKLMGNCIQLIDSFEFRFQYISNIEEDFWFRTNYNAPFFRVIRISVPEVYTADQEFMAVDAENLLIQSWQQCLDWIPERKGTNENNCFIYLESAGIAAHTVLVLKYLNQGAHEVLLYDLTQSLLEESQIPVAGLPHPPHGTIQGPTCSFYSSEIFYNYTDLSDPGSIYRAIILRDAATGSIEISFEQINSFFLPGIDKYSFDTRKVTCEGLNTESIDFLVFGARDKVDPVSPRSTPKKRRSPKRLRDPLPCILCVYSAPGVPCTPTFSLPFLVFAKHFHGLIVVLDLDQFSLQRCSPPKKVNVSKLAVHMTAVSSIQSVMRSLVEKGFTTPEQLGVYAGATGGLLSAASLVQSPWMAGALVVENGLFDLLKYHKFNPPVSVQLGSAAATTSSSLGTDSESVSDEGQQRSLGFLYGSSWGHEFGCAENSAEECRQMEKWSPLHGVQRVADMPIFPAVLLTVVGANDKSANTVSSVHSFKFIAELQRIFSSKASQNKPLLVSIDEEENGLPEAKSNTQWHQRVKETAISTLIMLLGITQIILLRVLHFVRTVILPKLMSITHSKSNTDLKNMGKSAPKTQSSSQQNKTTNPIDQRKKFFLSMCEFLESTEQCINDWNSFVLGNRDDSVSCQGTGTVPSHDHAAVIFSFFAVNLGAEWHEDD